VRSLLTPPLPPCLCCTFFSTLTRPAALKTVAPLQAALDAIHKMGYSLPVGATRLHLRGHTAASMEAVVAACRAGVGDQRKRATADALLAKINADARRHPLEDAVERVRAAGADLKGDAMLVGHAGIKLRELTDLEAAFRAAQKSKSARADAEKALAAVNARIEEATCAGRLAALVAAGAPLVGKVRTAIGTLAEERAFKALITAARADPAQQPAAFARLALVDTKARRKMPSEPYQSLLDELAAVDEGAHVYGSGLPVADTPRAQLKAVVDAYKRARLTGVTGDQAAARDALAALNASLITCVRRLYALADEAEEVGLFVLGGGEGIHTTGRRLTDLVQLLSAARSAALPPAAVAAAAAAVAVGTAITAAAPSSSSSSSSSSAAAAPAVVPKASAAVNQVAARLAALNAAISGAVTDGVLRRLTAYKEAAEARYNERRAREAEVLALIAAAASAAAGAASDGDASAAAGAGAGAGGVAAATAAAAPAGAGAPVGTAAAPKGAVAAPALSGAPKGASTAAARAAAGGGVTAASGGGATHVGGGGAAAGGAAGAATPPSPPRPAPAPKRPRFAPNVGAARRVPQPQNDDRDSDDGDSSGRR
jgi:hypothetical protein